MQIYCLVQSNIAAAMVYTHRCVAYGIRADCSLPLATLSEGKRATHQELEPFELLEPMQRLARLLRVRLGHLLLQLPRVLLAVIRGQGRGLVAPATASCRRRLLRTAKTPKQTAQESTKQPVQVPTSFEGHPCTSCETSPCRSIPLAGAVLHIVACPLALTESVDSSHGDLPEHEARTRCCKPIWDKRGLRCIAPAAGPWVAAGPAHYQRQVKSHGASQHATATAGSH